MLNILKAVCVIIGTIIGAGFASGREIYLFFNRYGIKGVFRNYYCKYNNRMCYLSGVEPY